MYKCFALFVICAAGILCAAEIHVAKSGNDGNAGGADAPLASIAKAAQLAKPGDVVKIGPGIYREEITFTRSGSKDAPIVFEGTRGGAGEYLTIVEAGGDTLSKWEPAAEIAPNVWKAPVEKRPNLIMMDGDMLAYINSKTMELAQWEKLPAEVNDAMIWGAYGKNCKRLPGFDLLRLPKEIQVTHSYFGARKELFWPAIGNVLTGWRDGYLYLRFASDDKPEEHFISVSYGGGFTLQNVSFLTFRDLHMRGSRKQFHLRGNSFGNTIEKCLLMHGNARIHIEENVTGTTVRDNVMTAGFISGEFFGLRSSKDMRSGLLYLVFKYIIGESLSDDIGVNDRGKNTRILDNIFMQGLIGMDAFGAGVEVSGNVVRKMSSVGICTSSTTVGEFHHNLIMDCGIPLRVHRLRHTRTRREEYHYCNLFVQAPDGGGHIFVHSTSYSNTDDAINFEKGTSVYKENPPDPVDAGKIYIYHNTFWGGNDGGSPLFTVTNLSKRFRMPLPFFVVNNIIKDNPRWSVVTHDLPGPNLLYVFDKDISLEERREKDVAKINRIVNLQDTKRIWNKNDIPGLPDMTLAEGSPALEAGIDISQPFAANGKQFQAFHGFKPGYFKGKAPAAGALQFGESQERFIAMHQRAEAIVKMLKELRDKTAKEARLNATGK